MNEWPLVVPNNDGIRPEGKPDECFYCRQGVGQPHGRDCVIVTKTVKLCYTLKVVVTVPHSWDEADILFQRNDGTWCADNALKEFEEAREKSGCLCSVFSAAFIETVDDTPVRKTQP